MYNETHQTARVARALIMGMVISVFFYGLAIIPQIHAQEAVIYLDSTQQVIRGFGAANILPWRPDMTVNDIDNAFGTEEGQVGLTILRLRIPPNASSFGDNISTAHDAHLLGVKIIAAPWSPPASMKTNNNLVGGELKTDSYAAYAAHLKAFADYMSSNGAPLYAISIQNEPDASVTYESCFWNATQMLNFMKNNAASIGIRVIMPESLNFNHSLSDPTLNDSAAAANVSIIGGHLYGGGLTSYPLAVSKGKELWMTEYLDTDTTWNKVLATGKGISDCMNVGMSAYVWWYIVRFYGPISEDGFVTKRGYVMSQFARFVRPEYVRVATTYSPRSFVYITAYQGDSKLVIVAINTGSSSVEQTFQIQNLTGGAAVFTPYVTSKTRDCQRAGDISVSNDSFSAVLDASSITTFVADGISSTIDHIPVPQTITLSQNYPNPFNPITTISYSLVQSDFVILKVYNTLGQEIRTLTDEFHTGGRYYINFNAEDLASGVYFYQLQVGSNPVQTRKMLLIR